MFPPKRDGGTIECSPGSGIATPSVPGKGRCGSVTISPKRTFPAAASTSEIRSHGSGNSSARRPKPGMIAVQPQSLASKARSSTSSTSPGSAPLTKTGPLTGFTCEKSSFATSSTPEPLWICSSEASRTRSRTDSPDSSSSAGSTELSPT